ncbi:MAG TPA: hypothetical protein VGX28_03810 [Frankiaceae bacterium]|jgi:hypothetical protein|nr:hypothetical protein [Frankiaceae bacterium]
MQRPVLALTVLALTASTVGIADAAVRKPPPPPCKTITDATGDSEYGAPLDIVSGDLASNAKTVTAVFRLADVSKSNSDAPTGQGYYFDFTPAGAATPIYLSYSVTPTTEAFNYGWVDGSIHRSLGSATGVYDTAKKEIRISAPVGAWTTYGNPKPSTKLLGLTMTTYWVLGAYVPNPATGATTGGGSLQMADDAVGKTYVAGSASCVAVGK